MPAIHIVDSTWICARPAVVAAAVADPVNWRRWWPEFDLAVTELRGDKGVRWTVHAGRGSRRTVGSMEVWLQPALDGVVAHYFLRLDAADGRVLRPRRIRRDGDRARQRAKRVFWELADQLDPGRLARISTPPSI